MAFLPLEVFVLPDVLAEEQKQIIELTNEVRKKHDRSLLAVSQKLDSSAQLKADDMAKKEYFAHNEGTKSLTSWLRAVGYSYRAAGENLAVGFSSAEDIVNAWVDSPTHYSNLVDKDFTEFGVGLTGGILEGEPSIYVAQHFARPATAVSTLIRTEKKVISTAEEKPATNPFVPKNDRVEDVSPSEPQVLAEKITKTKLETAPIIGKNEITPIDKYIHAKAVLSPVTNIFKVSRGIFLGAAIFFIIALGLKIFIEIKKQHYHIIAQTTALIALLLFLYKF